MFLAWRLVGAFVERKGVQGKARALLLRALHARAAGQQDTGWAEIQLLYAVLERLAPSPAVTLNRRSR